MLAYLGKDILLSCLLLTENGRAISGRSVTVEVTDLSNGALLLAATPLADLGGGQYACLWPKTFAPTSEKDLLAVYRYADFAHGERIQLRSEPVSPPSDLVASVEDSATVAEAVLDPAVIELQESENAATIESDAVIGAAGDETLNANVEC